MIQNEGSCPVAEVGTKANPEQDVHEVSRAKNKKDCICAKVDRSFMQEIDGIWYFRCRSCGRVIHGDESDLGELILFRQGMSILDRAQRDRPKNEDALRGIRV